MKVGDRIQILWGPKIEILKTSQVMEGVKIEKQNSWNYNCDKEVGVGGMPTLGVTILSSKSLEYIYCWLFVGNQFNKVGSEELEF